MSAADRDGVEVVWFKRDLRLSDHPALCAALRTGRPVLCLWVDEPSLLASPEFDSSHQVFIEQSLADLEQALAERGVRLTRRVGEWPEVLGLLQRELEPAGGIAGLWSHEETGNGLTYARDRRVGRYTREHGLPWHELPQRGVVRALADRDGWAARWRTRVDRTPLEAPSAIRGVDPGSRTIDHGPRPSLAELGLPPSSKPDAQLGGEREARRTMDSFLTERGEHYRSAMSSPSQGALACSRLSPHLAWGTLSATEALVAARAAREALRGRRDESARCWRASIRSFETRLAWRDHFTQKLETQPSLEFENMNRAYDGLREHEFSDDRFQAFAAARTGFPFVDACLRSLIATGWLNFRMRAMLVSFLSWDLWLHWREPAVWMARHFLDFEPGIHFSQFQMQAGTAGINTNRIYNPLKQHRDQDPEHLFVRRWVPELAGLDDEFLVEPWTAPPLVQRMAGCVVGRDYPAPIVDHAAAVRIAKQRLAEVKRRPETRAAALEVFERHGSRRGPRSGPRRADR